MTFIIKTKEMVKKKLGPQSCSFVEYNKNTHEMGKCNTPAIAFKPGRDPVGLCEEHLLYAFSAGQIKVKDCLFEKQIKKEIGELYAGLVEKS
jgi:hypothetical protein